MGLVQTGDLWLLLHTNGERLCEGFIAGKGNGCVRWIGYEKVVDQLRDRDLLLTTAEEWTE